jgi:hypothetical protein
MIPQSQPFQLFLSNPLNNLPAIAATIADSDCYSQIAKRGI